MINQENESIVEKHLFKTRNGEAILQRLSNNSTLQPVLFIHGFNSSEKIWYSYKNRGIYYEGFAEKALEDGYDVWLLGLSKSKMANLIELAEDDLLSALITIFSITNKKIKIVAHSMSGVLCRYLTHPVYYEKTRSDIMEFMVDEIVTLATPHQGFTVKQKFKNKISSLFEHFEIWASKKRRNPLYSGFFQFLSQSEFFITLNTNFYFNPAIKWTNAVAKHDFFIHKSSILPTETMQGVDQKFFNVNHFKVPFSDIIITIKNKFSLKSPKMDFFTTPPIYWSVDVYNWIFKIESENSKFMDSLLAVF